MDTVSPNSYELQNENCTTSVEYPPKELVREALEVSQIKHIITYF